MRILAVDTTTRSCSVAVAENSTVLGGITNISDQTHSRHLLDLIHTVIQDAGLTLSALEESVSAPDEMLQNIHGPCIFVGSGAVLYRDLIIDRLGDLACIASQERHIIQASTVAYLALKRFESGVAGEVADLVPYYIRQSDAELNFKRHHAKLQRR